MEARVARLEAHMAHMSSDMAEAKTRLGGIDDRLRGVETGLATLTERVAHLPSKGFIVSVVAGGLALLAAITVFADSIRAWIGG